MRPPTAARRLTLTRMTALYDTRFEASRAGASVPVVVVADPDPVACAAVTQGLREHGGFEVFGRATGLARADLLWREYAPDIIAAGIGTAGIDLAAIERAVREMPGVPIVVYSSTQDDEVLLSALRAGARGVVLAGDSIECLARALAAVARGEVAIPRRLTMRLIERVRRLREAPVGLRPVESTLSTREWEILDRVRAGAGTRGIADDLFLSEDTVYSHLKSAMRKLGVHDRIEAIAAVERIIADATVDDGRLVLAGAAASA